MIIKSYKKLISAMNNLSGFTGYCMTKKFEREKKLSKKSDKKSQYNKDNNNISKNQKPNIYLV